MIIEIYGIQDEQVRTFLKAATYARIIGEIEWVGIKDCRIDLSGFQYQPAKIKHFLVCVRKDLGLDVKVSERKEA